MALVQGNQVSDRTSFDKDVTAHRHKTHELNNTGDRTSSDTSLRESGGAVADMHCRHWVCAWVQEPNMVWLTWRREREMKDSSQARLRANLKRSTITQPEDIDKDSNTPITSTPGHRDFDGSYSIRS